MLPAAGNLAEYTVTELAYALKRTIEDAYGLLRVRGELSGFKKAASGHLYFTLKDDRACIDAVAWRGSLSKLAFEPEDGLEIVCTGRLTTYPGRSKYQLVVEQMEPAGLGALMALLEQRRKLLEAEGLFDAARKRPLPYLPEVVGVVTSPTGAVIRDILHRLADRFPRRVILWPVLVQGEGAAGQIAAAIRGFDALRASGPVPRPDVLIVARGGGSIEDLWAFNEEEVVRAAAACTIPLIAAVGHETDTTLIDHVADRRAPTPTAAAEMAVPVRRDLLIQTDELGVRLVHAMARRIDQLGRSIDGLARGLPRPETLLGLATQRLDDLSERLRLRTPSALVEAQRDRLRQRHARLAELVADRLRAAAGELAVQAARLAPEHIEGRLAVLQPRLVRERSALDRAIRIVVERLQGGVQTLAGQLEALSHARVLERGYAIVRGRTGGHVIPRLAAIGTETDLDIVFADGALAVRRADRARQRSRGERFDQGRLL